MKTEPARVLSLSDAFAAPRYPGTPGEAAALDRMAEGLAAAGWSVRREARKGRGWAARDERRNACISAVLVGLGVVVMAASRSVAAPTYRGRLFLMGWVVFSFTMHALARRRTDLGWPRPIVSDSVDAFDESAAGLPRVTILARAATPGRSLGGWRRGMAIGLVIVLAAVVVLDPFRPTWLFLAVALAILAAEPRPNRGGPGPGDNRVGLALLVELARTWPKSARSRVDVRFLALGGPRWDRRWVAREPAEGFVVELLDPGLGPTLQVGGSSDGLDLALGAARELWIPHEPAGTVPPPAIPASTSVLIRGDLANPRADPDALARAAQLVVELALRWSKKADEQPSPARVR